VGCGTSASSARNSFGTNPSATEHDSTNTSPTKDGVGQTARKCKRRAPRPEARRDKASTAPQASNNRSLRIQPHAVLRADKTELAIGAIALPKLTRSHEITLMSDAVKAGSSFSKPLASSESTLVGKSTVNVIVKSPNSLGVPCFGMPSPLMRIAWPGFVIPVRFTVTVCPSRCLNEVSNLSRGEEQHRFSCQLGAHACAAIARVALGAGGECKARGGGSPPEKCGTQRDRKLHGERMPRALEHRVRLALELEDDVARYLPGLLL
jgi:hypothetical protein